MGAGSPHWYVSRQKYWHDPEGRECIELASYEPSPGMLADRPYGEYAHYWQAAEDALAQHAETGLPITAANGLVYGDPDDPYDPADLRERATEAKAAAPRCDRCGEYLTDATYVALELDDETFCSEHCAEEAWAAHERDNTVWYQVDTVYAGALDSSQTFADGSSDENYAAADTWAQSEARSCAEDAKGVDAWDVYVFEHYCGLEDDECTCRQYDTDHHPTYSSDTWEPENSAASGAGR